MRISQWAKGIGKRIPPWVKDVGWICVVPLLLLYAVSLGLLVGWLSSTYCIGPQWMWYGPIPIRKQYENWRR